VIILLRRSMVQYAGRGETRFFLPSVNNGTKIMKLTRRRRRRRRRRRLYLFFRNPFRYVHVTTSCSLLHA